MREYVLARQGFERESHDRLRREAGWMSLILSSQSTEPITAAQLLGEPEPDPHEASAKKLLQAERELEKRLAARKG